MKQNKFKSAETLFDAIGMIDDKIIAEAQIPYQTSHTKSKSFFKILIASSCLIIATLLIISTVFVAGLMKIIPFAPTVDEKDPTPPENSSNFEQILTEADNMVEKLDAEDINFFDGKTKLIWRTENERAYNVITVYSTADVNQIKTALSQTQNKILPENAEHVEYQVWIAYGNGTVVSPYLENSAGNVGYAELFEYSPEVEPNDDFVKAVEKILVN